MLFQILQKLFKLREKRPDQRDERDEKGDIVKPFLDHMEDLRWTIFKCLVVLIVAMVAAFMYRTELMHILKHPLLLADPTGEMSKSIRSDGIFDSFILSLKLALYVGLILALPFLLYFIADFVLPALSRKEKRALAVGFSVGAILFVAGAYVSYIYIVPHTLAFFWGDTHQMELNPLWTYRNYISVFTWLVLGFGLMCEVPLVVVLLASIGVVSFKLLSSTRSYAMTGILVLAMVVAPSPDPMTMLTLALPIIAMYEGCIWIVWLMESRRRQQEKDKDLDDLTK
ncbi:MAG: twin-arginine translocase subunit TatC [Chthoniobacteraceae bacterium]